MRILFISSYYPPHEIGGWPQLTRDLNNALKERGHETLVLTSCYGVTQPLTAYGVARVLYPEADINHYRPWSILTYRSRLNWNFEQARTAIRDFKPDVATVHMMWNLNRAVPWMAEQLLPGRVVHYMASVVPYQDDPHVRYWRDPARHSIKDLGKRLIAPLALKQVTADLDRFGLAFDHMLCVSAAARLSLATALDREPDQLTVLYNGVELDRFYPSPDRDEAEADRAGLRLLFAGNLVEHKGLHTAIEALDEILRLRPNQHITLTVAGKGHQDYEDRIHKMVWDSGLEPHVNFLGKVPRDHMPALMRGHDVFLLPSTWEEPLARVLHEAMASGLAVVGTLTGGTGEALIDGLTGLAFDPGDYKTLACRILALADDGDLRSHLSRNARELVRAKFSFERMVDEMEAYMLNIASESG